MFLISLGLRMIIIIGIIGVLLDLFSPFPPKLASGLFSVAMIGTVFIGLTLLPAKNPAFQISATTKGAVLAVMISMGLLTIALLVQGEKGGVPVRSAGLLFENLPFVLRNGREFWQTTQLFFFTKCLFMLVGGFLPCLIAMMLLDFIKSVK